MLVVLQTSVLHYLPIEVVRVISCLSVCLFVCVCVCVCPRLPDVPISYLIKHAYVHLSDRLFVSMSACVLTCLPAFCPPDSLGATIRKTSLEPRGAK